MKTRFPNRCMHLALCFALCMVSSIAYGRPIQVVVSIKPLHSLVSRVMGAYGQPQLLMDGRASPHGYVLKPSQARMLQQADLVFWIGPELENFLHTSLPSLAPHARTLAMLDIPDLTLLASYGQGHQHDVQDYNPDDATQHNSEQEHGIHDDDTQHNSEQAHGIHDDAISTPHQKSGRQIKPDTLHNQAGPGTRQQSGATDHLWLNKDRPPNAVNSHIWLTVDNARILVNAIAEQLSLADPVNAVGYAHNAQITSTDLDVLDAMLHEKLSKVEGGRYLVFHNAYQYLEEHYGLQQLGIITLNPEVPVSASHIAGLRKQIARNGAACIFVEPQFPRKLIANLTGGSDAMVAELDPLGAKFPAGPDQYWQTMRTLVTNMAGCLERSESGSKALAD